MYMYIQCRYSMCNPRGYGFSAVLSSVILFVQVAHFVSGPEESLSVVVWFALCSPCPSVLYSFNSLSLSQT